MSSIEIQAIQVIPKDDGYASILIRYVQTIVNQNRLMVTEEERRNPVIFKKEVQNYITVKMSIAKNKDSAKVLSGGNFDFKDSSGQGYHMTIKYTEFDEAAKLVIKTIRESGFACLPSRNSTTCFIDQPEPTEEGRDNILQSVCEKVGELKS
jgi:hypothetical protein